MTPVDERLDLAHNSPVIVADPDDRDFLALGSRIDNPEFGCALHVSDDGGRSWVPSNPVTALPEGSERCYAPELAFGPEGELFFLFLGLQGPGNTPVGAYIASSKDRGRSFSPPRQVLGAERYMVRMAMDRTQGARGRLHLIWLEATSDPPLGGLGPPPNPILAAHSDDGGATWSRPVRVSDPDRPRAVAPAVAVGPDHRVHVIYYDLVDDARDYQGLAGPTWEGTWTLVASSSRDGGRTFSPGAVVDNGLVPPQRVMVIFTMPPPTVVADDRGRVIVAWHDARNGDWDVFSSRSTDGGATWSSPQRVNRDPVSNGRHQHLPRLAVAPGGRVWVVFYDRRGDTDNRRDDVWMSWSNDGGRRFADGLRLTSESSDSEIGVRYPLPSAEGLVERGARIALVASSDTAVAAWTDTRNAEFGNYHQEVFATEVRLTRKAG